MKPGKRGRDQGGWHMQRAFSFVASYGPSGSSLNMSHKRSEKANKKVAARLRETV